MAGVLERIHRANRPPFHSLTPREARIAYRMGAEILDLPRAPLPRVEDLEAAGRPARLYAPSAAKLPVLLYLHGGGFTIGDLETHDSLCRQLALRSGAAVLALDYRLAPEHRFPAAVDDSWAALAWLHEHAGSLGLDGSRLAVGGDSAGGTLAAGVAFFARDRGLPLALQLLITPGTAANPCTASQRLFANGFLLDAAGMAWFFDHYTRASRPPASCWPSATRWSTKALPTPTRCAPPPCPCSWSFTAASRTTSSKWAARSLRPSRPWTPARLRSGSI
jgi:acetyl esterase